MNLLRRPHPQHAVFTLLVVAAITFASGLSRTEASASTTCTKVASPSGSDSASGAPSAPYRTAQKLADSLSAGDTGCLRSGRYEQSVKISRGGRADARVYLRSYPGERVEVKGRFWIARGADHVTVSGLKLDGTNSGRLPSPTVNANNASFANNDVTNNHTSICFLLGSSSYGTAGSTLIDRNRIHDCGKIPANNHEHGIYIEKATDAKITNNLIYNNADRGIQLYPDAQRTRIIGNVIDGNGQGIIFSGAGRIASNDTTVEANVITNSKLRNNVEYHYPSGTPTGRRNYVRRNCISGGARDDGDGGVSDEVGFSASDNLRADPQFVNRAERDFRLRAGSRCRRVLPDGGARVAAASSRRPELSLRSEQRSRRPGSIITLRGGVLGADASAKKRLAGRLVNIRFVSSNGKWRIGRHARLRADGRFAQSIRLSTSQRPRTVRLRADLPRGRWSPVVRVAVRP